MTWQRKVLHNHNFTMGCSSTNKTSPSCCIHWVGSFSLTSIIWAAKLYPTAWMGCSQKLECLSMLCGRCCVCHAFEDLTGCFICMVGRIHYSLLLFLMSNIHISMKVQPEAVQSKSSNLLKLQSMGMVMVTAMLMNIAQ